MHNTTVIGAEAVVVESTVILNITVGHTECVPIRENIAGPCQIDTRRTRCVTTRLQEVIITAPGRSGRYLLVKQM